MKLYNRIWYALICILGLAFWAIMIYEPFQLWLNVSSFICVFLVILILFYIDFNEKIRKIKLLKWLLMFPFVLLKELVLSIFKSLQSVFNSAKSDILN